VRPFVTVVVPTYNRYAGAVRLLTALAAQTYPAARFEVVVVDDGSTDGTADLLRDVLVPYALRAVRQANAGPAQARNRGVEQARGRLIVFLDDDVVPRPELLARHVEAHKRGLNLVVIGPMVSPPSWLRPTWVRWEEAKLRDQYDAMVAGRYPCTPRQFYTGNASLSRDLFLASGGFDATFRRAEDVELAFRMRDLGADFVFEPRAEVLHYASRTFEAWAHTPYQYGQYDVAMARDKGHEALDCAAAEFHQRHRLTRLLARSCAGSPRRARGAVLALRGAARAADLLGASGASMQALSGIFNLLYWQGVSDALGGPEPTWRLVAAHAPLASRLGLAS
jgi:GT2 family glycosyltransferase